MRLAKVRLAFVISPLTVVLVALTLSSCGGGSPVKSIAPVNTSFAFLQINGSSGSAAAIRSTVGNDFRVPGRLNPSAPTARTPISSTVNIATGVVDAYLMDINTGIQTKLNSQSADYTGIQLSSDGTKVVFTANDSAGYSQIFVADVTGFDNPTQLTSDNPNGHYLPTFSSDGSTIAASKWIYAARNSSLITVPTAGGPITEILIPFSIGDAWPGAFTPDGKSLVFEGGSGSIYLTNLDGSGLTRLTIEGGSYWDVGPSVSPDGAYVEFTREIGPGASLRNIYVTSITGESAAAPATQLTTDGFSWDAVYAGAGMVFVSSKDNQTTTKNDNLYKMDTDGTNVTRLTDTTLEDCFHPY
jgi:Tol biopolymer transport system component